jgi:GNAT superfamily N-acetyltransferase
VFASEHHSEAHDLSRFDSGQPSLDAWLRDHARGVEARRVCRTFVWRRDGHAVVAYYTLAAHVIERATLPRSVGRGSPDQIPAVLLARLALDKILHGQGLGGALLADALARAVIAAENVGARFVVVDALDETAARFYEHHGFRQVPDTMRLVQKMSDIAEALS